VPSMGDASPVLDGETTSDGELRRVTPATMPLESPVMPELPDTWVPDDAVIFGVGRHRVDEGVWEVLLPSYAIVGRGASFDDAVHQASEQLEDYFRLAARDGLSFEQAARPISARWMTKLLAETAASVAVRRLRHTRARMRLLRFPARHAFC
jgi:hypothetical protein